MALSVNVGHWSDPAEVPGLAHFLEHMLFMGNWQFPKEAEWEQFLTENGGGSNAFTAAEQTTYYFGHLTLVLWLPRCSDSQPFLPHRSSRPAPRSANFAWWRASSLATPTTTTVCARRSCCTPRRIQRTLEFGWGNLEMLETTPRKQKLDLRAQLKQFHARFDHAAAMKLVVYTAGGQLDTLEKWVRREIRIHPQQPRRRSPFLRFCGRSFPAAAAHVLDADPVKESFKLTLSWILPPLHQQYLTKLLHLAEHLLGHESAGSLFGVSACTRLGHGVTRRRGR